MTKNNYIDEREKLITPFLKNKEVLDLGVGDISDRFLHKIVKSNSKKCLGVELNEKYAQNLRDNGFDIITGNVETINLNKQFDVVLAGDLIEHLDNPGLFLDNVKKHLKKEGSFIFNTPNIYSINFLLKGLLFGGNVPHYNEHTLGFTEQLLTELLTRHEFKIIKVVYFSHKEKTLKSIIIRTLSALVPKWRENILIVCEKNE